MGREHGNAYQIVPTLVGPKIVLLCDPSIDLAIVGSAMADLQKDYGSGEVRAAKTATDGAAMSTPVNSHDGTTYVPDPRVGVRGVYLQIVAVLRGHRLVHHTTLDSLRTVDALVGASRSGSHHPRQ